MEEKNKNIKSEPIRKQSLIYKRDKDREKVKGIFRFFECPGSELKFVFRAYKGDAIEKYTLIDGQVYSLPLGVAKHLNKKGSYPVHHFATDESGRVSAKIGQRVRRFGFQSLEFVDVEELSTAPSELVTVESV